MASGLKSPEKSAEQLFHPDTLKPSSVLELEDEVKQRKDARPLSAPSTIDNQMATAFRVPKEMLDMSWYAGLVFGQEVGRTNIVFGVTQDSPAARAQVVSHTLNTVWLGGIRMGDALIRVGNKAITGKNRVLEVWQVLKDEGEAAESRGMLLTFLRSGGGNGGQPLEFTVCVVTRPSSATPDSPKRSAQRSLDDRILLEKHPSIAEPKASPVPPLSHFTGSSVVASQASPVPSASSPPASFLNATYDSSPARVRLGTSAAESSFAASTPNKSAVQESVAEEAAIKSLVRQVSEANRERREESRRLGKAVEELHASRLETEAKVKAAQANALSLQREREELLQLASQAVLYTEQLETAASSHQAQSAYHAAIAFQAKQRADQLEKELLESRRQLAEEGIHNQRFGTHSKGDARNESAPGNQRSSVVIVGGKGKGDLEKEALEKLVRRYEREVEEMLVEVEEARGAGERLREYTRTLEEQIEQHDARDSEDTRVRLESEERRRREAEEERSELRERNKDLEEMLHTMKEQRESMQEVSRLEGSVAKMKGERANAELQRELERLQLKLRKLEEDAEGKEAALAAAQAEAAEQARMRKKLEEELRESMGGKDALLGEALALAETLSVQMRDSPRGRSSGNMTREGEKAAEEVRVLEARAREQEDAIARLREELRKEGEKRERMVKKMESVAKEQMNQLAGAEAKQQEKLRAEIAAVEKRNLEMSREVSAMTGRLKAAEEEASALRKQQESMRARSQELEREKREGEAAVRVSAREELQATTEQLQRKMKTETDALGQQLQKQKDSNRMLRSELEASVLKLQAEQLHNRASETAISDRLSAQVQALTTQLREQAEEVVSLRDTLAGTISAKQLAEDSSRVKLLQVETDLAAQVQSLVSQVDAKQRQLDLIQSSSSSSSSPPAPLPAHPPTLAYQPKSQPVHLFDSVPEPPTRPPLLAAAPPASLLAAAPVPPAAYPLPSPRAVPSPRKEPAAASVPLMDAGGGGLASTQAQELAAAQREIEDLRREIERLRSELAAATCRVQSLSRPRQQVEAAQHSISTPSAASAGTLLTASASATAAVAMAGCAVDILGRGEGSPCLAHTDPDAIAIPALMGASLFCSATGEVSAQTLLPSAGGMLAVSMAAQAIELLGDEREVAGGLAWVTMAQGVIAGLPLLAVIGQSHTRELCLGGASVAVTAAMALGALELLMPGHSIQATFALFALGGRGVTVFAGWGWWVVMAMSWSVRVLSATVGLTLLVGLRTGGSGEAAETLVACSAGLAGLVMAGRAVWLLGGPGEREIVEASVMVAQVALLSTMLLGPSNLLQAARGLKASAAAATSVGVGISASLLWQQDNLRSEDVRQLGEAALEEALQPIALLPLSIGAMGAAAALAGMGVGRQLVCVAGGMAAVGMALRAVTLLGAEHERDGGWWMSAGQGIVLVVPALVSMRAEVTGGTVASGIGHAVGAALSVAVTGVMVGHAAELLMPQQSSEALLILLGWIIGFPIALSVTLVQAVRECAQLCAALRPSAAVLVATGVVTVAGAALARKDEPIGVLVASLGGVCAMAMAAYALKLLESETANRGFGEWAAVALQAVALLPSVRVAPKILAFVALASSAFTAWMVACAVEKLGDEPSMQWCGELRADAWFGMAALEMAGTGAGQMSRGLSALVGLTVVGAVAGEGGAVSIGGGALGMLMALSSARLLGAVGEGGGLQGSMAACSMVVIASPLLGLLRRGVSPPLVLAAAQLVGGWCSAEMIVLGRESATCAVVMEGHASVAVWACVAAMLASARVDCDPDLKAVVGFAGGLVSQGMAREALVLLSAPHCAAPSP